MNACLEELSGFYYFGNKLFWDEIINSIEQKYIFIAWISNSTYININELDMLPVALNFWVTQWQKSKLIIYTSNTTIYNDFKNLTLQVLVNKSFYKILLLAILNNVLIKVWLIKSSDNRLADTLSRKNLTSIANLYSH